MECELCGHNAQLTKAEIEGTVLSVRFSCVGLGQIVEIKVEVEERREKPLRIESGSIRQDFAKAIKAGRTALGLTIEQLEQKMNEKASVLDRVERGMRPTDMLAKKLEKTLKIKLLGFDEA